MDQELPQWVKEWITDMPAADELSKAEAEMRDWLLSRPASVQKVARDLPPACLVSTNRRLICPKPGQVAIIYSYTEDGKVSVIAGPGGGMQYFCRAEWLKAVGYRYGLTKEKIAGWLDGPE